MAGTNGQNDIGSPESTAERPSSSDDLADRYRHHLAHLDLPKDRKAELIHAVWHVMRSFVDRAFGDDPAQLASKHGDQSRISHEGVARPVIPSSPRTNSGDKTLRGAFNAHGNKKESR